MNISIKKTIFFGGGGREILGENLNWNSHNNSHPYPYPHPPPHPYPYPWCYPYPRFSNAARVYIRLCKHGKRFLLLKWFGVRVNEI